MCVEGSGVGGFVIGEEELFFRVLEEASLVGYLRFVRRRCGSWRRDRVCVIVFFIFYEGFFFGGI